MLLKKMECKLQQGKWQNYILTYSMLELSV